MNCNKIDSKIKEELKGADEYRAMGLIDLAKDESRHAKVLRGIKKRKCGK